MRFRVCSAISLRPGDRPYTHHTVPTRRQDRALPQRPTSHRDAGLWTGECCATGSLEQSTAGRTGAAAQVRAGRSCRYRCPHRDGDRLP